MITVTMTPEQAIRTASALSTSVDRSRKFCRDTDSKYGDLNNLYRDEIECNRLTHAELLEALRAVGYPMSDQDIPDDPIDAKLPGDQVNAL